MKVCGITPQVYDLYRHYIPPMYKGAYQDRDYILLGIYDETGTKGAAVVVYQEANAHILTLAHDSDVSTGECAGLIGNALEEVLAKAGLYKIVYVHGGEEEELEALDYSMMDAGFYPNRGEVVKYKSSLARIYELQGRYIDDAAKRLDRMPIVDGENLSAYQKNFYNKAHPDNSYKSSESDPRLCLFMIEQEKPVVGIFARENEEGSLILTWMGYDSGVDRMVRMRLIFALIATARKYYPDETEVIICPFTREVVALINQFGFVQDLDQDFHTHVYTRYV